MCYIVYSVKTTWIMYQPKKSFKFSFRLMQPVAVGRRRPRRTWRSKAAAKKFLLLPFDPPPPLIPKGDGQKVIHQRGTLQSVSLEDAFMTQYPQSPINHKFCLSLVPFSKNCTDNSHPLSLCLFWCDFGSNNKVWGWALSVWFSWKGSTSITTSMLFSKFSHLALYALFGPKWSAAHQCHCQCQYTMRRLLVPRQQRRFEWVERHVVICHSS